MRDCIEEALDLLASRADEKRITLAYMIADEVPSDLVGDHGRLRQVLINLLSNAIKFTETGEVVVSVDAEPLDAARHLYIIHVAVRDTGIGIPQERLQDIFQAFRQAGNSLTRTHGGTGLGLTISKRLVELMGGRLWVESKIGVGSTFHFTLTAAAVPADPRPFMQHHQPHLTGKHVLIVDDNKTNRQVLTRQVHAWGMLHTATEDPAEALEWVQRGQVFDLAILDMCMPHMDGLHLAQEIRRSEAAQDLPLVLWTSLGLRSEMLNRVAGAAITVLPKPVRPGMLYDTLNAMFLAQSDTPSVSFHPAQIDHHMGQRHPLHILLAEDNQMNQKVALRLLEKLGYRADVAANGREVLTALRWQTYDVVLMDVQMPEMDGIEATRRLRSDLPPERQPYVVAMTAYAMQGNREWLLNMGMDGYISKPVRMEDLMSALGKTSRIKHHPSCTCDVCASSLSKDREMVHNEGTTYQTSMETDTTRLLMNSIDTTVFYEFLEMVGGDDPEETQSFVMVYLEESTDLLHEIQRTFDQGDAEALQRAAHTFKSLSGQIGALHLSELCKHLEQIATTGDSSLVSSQIQQIATTYQQVQTDLQALLRSAQ